LLVFDGIDAIQHYANQWQVLVTAEAIARSGSARVLVTIRDFMSEKIPAEQLQVRPLDRAQVEALVLELQPSSATSDQLDASIVQFMRRHHNVLIGDSTAEHIRTGLGLADSAGEERELEVKGRDLISDTSKTVRVRSSEVREALPEIASGREQESIMRIAQDLGGGNPRVIRTLVARSAALSAKALLEELDRELGDQEVIPPHALSAIEAQLDEAVRARELSAMGEAMVEAGNMRQAFKAFSDAVTVRSTMPSTRLRAGAHFDRGRVSLALGEYEQANADLEEAARLYRMLSAHRELVPVLEALAEVHQKMSHVEEAMSLLREALDVTKSIGDPVGAERIESRLALLEQVPTEPLQNQEVAPAQEVLQGDDRVLSVEFLVSGRVQGVGFRTFVQECAREIGLEGDAVNLEDGRIRVRATGPRRGLKQLEERLHRGPPAAVVEQVQVTILGESGASQQPPA
jgi:acylphosphatase